jgi:hypothetical protein
MEGKKVRGGGVLGREGRRQKEKRKPQRKSPKKKSDSRSISFIP